MLGKGKYDDATTTVRETMRAEGVILLVFNGVHGSGFSVQADERTTRALPELLENMARQIRADIVASDKLDVRKTP